MVQVKIKETFAGASTGDAAPGKKQKMQWGAPLSGSVKQSRTK